MRHDELRPLLKLPRRTGLSLLGVACLGAWWGRARRADASDAPALRIIVHPSNAVASADREQVADIFLKKVTRWPDGEVIRPADLRPNDPIRQLFSQTILRRSVQAVRSYWQQRIFSGRDVPPPELDSEASVIAFVSRFPGAIGYVSGGAKLSGVAELRIT